VGVYGEAVEENGAFGKGGRVQERAVDRVNIRLAYGEKDTVRVRPVEGGERMSIYICSICKKVFGVRKDARRHVREVHKIRGKQWKRPSPTDWKRSVPVSDITRALIAVSDDEWIKLVKEMGRDKAVKKIMERRRK